MAHKNSPYLLCVPVSGSPVWFRGPEGRRRWYGDGVLAGLCSSWMGRQPSGAARVNLSAAATPYPGGGHHHYECVCV